MALFADMLRYWRTLRHLHPIQFYGRLWFRLNRPSPDLSAAPAIRPVEGPWLSPAARLPGMTAPGEIDVLNRTVRPAESGWDDPALDKLWRYHLHYLDDLTALDQDRRRAWHVELIDDWIAANPPSRGTGWEPYPTARRIMNWIKWSMSGHQLPQAAVDSLAVQARWLRRRLEWHLLGNHLFVNAKALVFAGLFFRGAEAGSWLNAGVSILRRQLPEQILPDGAHFELSPMYHALILEDVLDLVNLLRAHRPALDSEATALLVDCESRVDGMRRWLRAMEHPDGGIALFNDSAFGIAPSCQQLAAYATRLGFDDGPDLPDLLWLPDSGYARLSRGDALLLADMARIGPDYIPGHAHADTLSCELSLGAQRILVNGGTSIYGAGPERRRQRGTAAHNSVIVAGANSTETWGGFRVARRARPFGVTMADRGHALEAAASHDGYRHLPGRPIHRRQWRLSDGRLRIEDMVTPARHGAIALFHFHPDIVVEIGDAGQGRLSLPDGRSVRWRSEGDIPRLAAGSWHPEFGVAIPNHHLVLPLRDGRAAFELIWG